MLPLSLCVALVHGSVLSLVLYFQLNRFSKSFKNSANGTFSMNTYAVRSVVPLSLSWGNFSKFAESFQLLY